MLRSPPPCVAVLVPALAVAWSVALAGCDDLDEFRTGEGTVFHGEVIGSDSESDATSFIRQGFESHTEMEITFDPDLASGSAVVADEAERVAPPAAGTIHTYGCPPKTDFCDEAERTPGDFDHAQLEPIPSLNHDALSQYDFPGAGRVRNYILGARFASGEGAAAVSRHAMVFVSLMDNGSLEVRVIAPGVVDDAGETLHPPLFGVFGLEKRSL